MLAGLPAGQAALIRACSSVSRAAVFASSKMADNDGAHQFEHVLRVHRTATHIASRESAAGANIDMRIVQLAAILHDVYDRKVYRPGPGDPSGAELLLRFLCTLDLPDGHAARVVAIADGVSFSKQRKTPLSEEQRSLELDIVQDADRLDAMGAVGVARCFAYGGSAGCALESSRVHFDDKVRASHLVSTIGGFLTIIL